MPSKKKSTTSSKKGKKSNSTKNDAKVLTDWLDNGHLDAKGLSRALPELVRKGKVEPKDVSKMAHDERKDLVSAKLQKSP